MSMIECKDVCLSYDMGTVLENLTFCVNKGDYLCIVGENGSGKSTLAKAILGLKAPSFGTIKYGDGLTKNSVGYLPQQSGMNTDFPATVWETIISGRVSKMGFRPFFNKEDKEIALMNAEKLKISDLLKKSVFELSGGQRRRVLLARALCAGDRLILLDEPVAGLDPVSSLDMYNVIDEINKAGTVVIMISHDIPGALARANKILHLRNEPLFFGSTEDYIKSGLSEGLCERAE